MHFTCRNSRAIDGVRNAAEELRNFAGWEVLAGKILPPGGKRGCHADKVVARDSDRKALNGALATSLASQYRPIRTLERPLLLRSHRV
jgi:hypothetical protein